MGHAVQTIGHLPGFIRATQKEVDRIFSEFEKGSHIQIDSQNHAIQHVIALADLVWDRPQAPPIEQVFYVLFLGAVTQPPTDWIMDHELRLEVERVCICRARWEPVPDEDVMQLAVRLSEHVGYWSPPEHGNQRDIWILFRHILHQQPMAAMTAA